MTRALIRPALPGPTATLALLGSLVVIATAALGFVIPLARGRMERPSAGLIERLPHWAYLAAHSSGALDDPRVVAVLLIAACSLAFAACAMATSFVWRSSGRRDLWIVVAGAGALSSLLNVVALPNMNSNIYNYMLRGRVAGAYGQNPYTTAAKEFPDDPLTPYANPRNTQTPGGKYPAWMILNVAMARLAGDDPVTCLLSYRAMLFAFSMLNLGLVAFLARRLIPDRALAGFALWAWNPIVILNGQSRTDTVMVCYLLVGMTLLVRSRRGLGAIALVLSVLVKLVTLPLLAVAVLSEIRAGRWRELLAPVSVALVTATVVGLPLFWGRVEKTIADLLWFTGATTSDVTGPDWTAVAPRVFFAFLVLGVGLTRDGSWGSVFRGWTLVQFFFSLFFAKFGSADYHMTLLAIVAVTMRPRMLVAAITLSFGSFLFDEWYRVGSETFQLPELLSIEPRVAVLLPLAIGALGLAGAFLVAKRVTVRIEPAREATAD